MKANPKKQEAAETPPEVRGTLNLVALKLDEALENFRHERPVLAFESLLRCREFVEAQRTKT
ncbi:MAG: hypothetical protein ACRD2O_00045 [Terriglobia bacterium]